MRDRLPGLYLTALSLAMTQSIPRWPGAQSVFPRSTATATPKAVCIRQDLSVLRVDVGQRDAKAEGMERFLEDLLGYVTR